MLYWLGKHIPLSYTVSEGVLFYFTGPLLQLSYGICGSEDTEKKNTWIQSIYLIYPGRYIVFTDGNGMK